jgi:hypothetical protein
MKLKHAGWAIALAAAAAAPAFAQSTSAVVTSGTGATVTTSTNIAVTPAVPAPAIAARTVTIPGAVVAEIGSNTVVAGNTRTTTTGYWVNVPPDVTRDPAFQRWQALK